MVRGLLGVILGAKVNVGTVEGFPEGPSVWIFTVGDTVGGSNLVGNNVGDVEGSDSSGPLVG